MLSDAQDKLHWSSHRNQRGDCGWGLVVRNTGWPHTIISPEAKAASAARSDWHKQVIALADMLLRKNSDMTPINALRYGAYALATGKAKSHTKFDNDEFDLVLNMFRLLADPLDLRAVMDRNDYEAGVSPGAKRRLKYRISQAPAAAVQHILTDQLDFYGTKDVDDLPMDKLTALVGKLESWKKSFNRRAERRQVVTAEGHPF